MALETPHFQAYRGDVTPRFVNEAELEYEKYTGRIASEVTLRR